MAVTPTLALCTVSDIERELAVAVGSIVGDALTYLESLIDGMSEAAQVFLGRGPLAYRTGIVEAPRARGWPKVRVRTSPLRSVTTVTLYSVDLLPADYIVEDDGRTGILFFRHAWPFTGYLTPFISSSDIYADTESQEGLSVTYDAGWWLPNMGAKPILVPAITDLPFDIRRAMGIAVSTAYRGRGSDRTVQSERLMSHSVTYARDDGTAYGLPGFTSEAAAMLSRRKRTVQA